MSGEKTDTVSFGKGKTYTLDAHGFLDPPEQWDEEFAEGIARLLGIVQGLTPSHWEFIRYLRRKFIDERKVPLVVEACAENGLRLNRLALLFPTGYHRGACRIAGINYRFLYENSFWLTCESYVVLKSKYRITPLGFLENFEDWDRNFAGLVAQEAHMPPDLSARHWQVLEFLRDTYRVTRNIPTVFVTCRNLGIDFEELHELFPGGYRRGACRMAGLPFQS